MAPPEDDWTLRWDDGRPFDIESESKHFVRGQRGQARRFLPKLVNFMEYGERVVAVGMAVPNRWNIRRFLAATDRALLVFDIPGSGERIVDDKRMPYAAITACQIALPPFKLPFLQFAKLQAATSDETVGMSSIPKAQAEALREALAVRLPEGILA